MSGASLISRLTETEVDIGYNINARLPPWYRRYRDVCSEIVCGNGENGESARNHEYPFGEMRLVSRDHVAGMQPVRGPQ
jgi:hypothetical protein